MDSEKIVLTRDLRQLLSSLSSCPESVRLFKIIFKGVYNYFFPLRRSLNRTGGVIYLYWLLPIMRHKHKITDQELQILSFIYYLTNQGKESVTANIVASFSLTRKRQSDAVLHRLIQRSLLSRSKYYRYEDNKRCKGRRDKWINITPEGLEFIRSLENDLRTILYNGALTYITMD